MTGYSVNHIASSPHYPQSNSLAEKYVQIVKNLFYKAKEEGTDLYKSLMIYRNTPLSHKLQSPMQILHHKLPELNYQCPVQQEYNRDWALNKKPYEEVFLLWK